MLFCEYFFHNCSNVFLCLNMATWFSSCPLVIFLHFSFIPPSFPLPERPFPFENETFSHSWGHLLPIISPFRPRPIGVTHFWVPKCLPAASGKDILGAFVAYNLPLSATVNRCHPFLRFQVPPGCFWEGHLGGLCCL